MVCKRPLLAASVAAASRFMCRGRPTVVSTVYNVGYLPMALIICEAGATGQQRRRRRASMAVSLSRVCLTVNNLS